MIGSPLDFVKVGSPGIFVITTILLTAKAALSRTIASNKPSSTNPIGVPLVNDIRFKLFYAFYHSVFL